MREFDIPELNALVHPRPALAMHLIYKVALEAPRFMLKKPRQNAPRGDRIEWDRSRMQMLVSVSFAINSLHRYFRTGLPRDAEPEYYEALDTNNHEQVHRLFDGQETEICLGHVQSHVTLILNYLGTHGSNVIATGKNHEYWAYRVNNLYTEMDKYKSAA